MLPVSSAWIAAIGKQAASVRRLLTIGGSDYSGRVARWPTVARRWDEIKPVTVTLDLSNEDGAFNFFFDNPLAIRGEVLVKLGAEVATNSYEYATFFAGRGDNVRYRDGKCSLSVVDKFKQLSDRVLGSQNTPVDYSGSDVFVHDLAWYLCTSHGGFSATANSSNPDIDYPAFTSWTSIFSADNVRVRARYDGQKVTEALRQIAELTQSAIFIKDNKISFARYSATDSANSTLDGSNIAGMETVLDDRQIINKAIAFAQYSVTSNYHVITVSDVLTASVNSFSLRERVFESKNIWYQTSAQALNIVQRMTTFYGTLKGQHRINGFLDTAHLTIGDVIKLTDLQLGVDDEGYRVMEESIDMDSGARTLSVDQTQYATPFRLDISALDGTDVLL